MEKTWHWILDGPCPGGYNMALDEFLLSELESDPHHPATYLRFYQWSTPTLSLGISQKVSKVVNYDFCRKHGIGIVRRATGGKAVLHHQEITYAVVSNDADHFPLQNILETYRLISAGLQAGLKDLGIETSLATGESVTASLPGRGMTLSCFALANHYEILCQGRKLAGSAQRRLKHAFLQHGSILIAYDDFLWENSLLHAAPHPGHRQVAVLQDLLPAVTPESTISEILSRGFSSTFQIQLKPFHLDENQLEEIFRLGIQKYIEEPRGGKNSIA
jgi:lipoate-protein ligase A